eukprot:jgi/Ulvmu1/11985/UM082_0064.1
MENSGAYFVGRAELLSWINSTLGLQYTKVEQTHNGAVACQIMDALHPGMVPLSKVKFNASTEYDMINNYKVLQNVFNKLNVSKSIDVNKLIKGKPLDNMEFMQWLKSHFDKVTAGQGVPEYDGPARRSHTKGGTAISARGGPIVASRPGNTKMNSPATRSASDRSSRTGGVRAPAPTAMPSGQTIAHQDDGALNDKIRELEKGLAEASQKESEVTQERDFYFSKLREIELLCQQEGMKEAWDVMQHVENILYAATEEEGTQARLSALDALNIAAAADGAV